MFEDDDGEIMQTKESLERKNKNKNKTRPRAYRTVTQIGRFVLIGWLEGNSGVSHISFWAYGGSMEYY